MRIDSVFPILNNIVFFFNVILFLKFISIASMIVLLLVVAISNIEVDYVLSSVKVSVFDTIILSRLKVL